MQKLDKVFAGLIVVAMALFWVIMSPAAITSKVSEARPTALEVMPAPEKLVRKRVLTDSQKRRREAGRLSKEQIARLKQRKRDTPPEAQKLLIESMLNPSVPAKGDEPLVQRQDEFQHVPTLN